MLPHFHRCDFSFGRLAHAFTTHKKRVPCPSRVLCERAGLLEAVCREPECLALATLPFPGRRTALLVGLRPSCNVAAFSPMRFQL